MAPLFGPLANAGASNPAGLYAAPAYGPAPLYPAAAASAASLAQIARRRGPILPAPPLRAANPLGDPSPVGVIGSQITRPDRLFGPFASFAVDGMGGAGGAGPSGL
ncbi:MAG TPA: hypothetical protein VNJ52_13580 [Patescibacteria group bacterium]|nr:hypothetical protein [Patescibacteria group bacterium]